MVSRTRFKDIRSNLTLEKIHRVSISETKWVKLFMEIIAVYSYIRTKHIKIYYGGTMYEEITAGTNSNLCTSKRQFSESDGTNVVGHDRRIHTEH